MWTMLEQSGYQTTEQPVTEQSTLISQLVLLKNIKRMEKLLLSL